MRLTCTELSLRTKNKLRENGIKSTEKLAGKSASELLALRKFGPAALAEVREEMARLGLKLRDDE